MAKTWEVHLPIVGEWCFEVEADTKEEAIKLALQNGCPDDADVTWEAVEKVVEGNVFHGTLNEAYAEEIE